MAYSLINTHYVDRYINEYVHAPWYDRLQCTCRFTFEEYFNPDTNKTKVVGYLQVSANHTSQSYGFYGGFNLGSHGSVTYTNTGALYGTFTPIGGSVTAEISHSSTGGISSIPISFISAYDLGYTHIGKQFGMDIEGDYPGFYVEGAGATLTLAASYKLTVDKNDGSATTTYWNVEGATQTIANPTRTGYDFDGWTLSGGGSISGTTYTYGSTNGTLTAKWKLKTYTVSYNANGGSSTPSSQTKSYGVDLTLRGAISRANASAGSYTVTLDANGGSVSPSSKTAERTTSYTFYRWNTKADGTGTSYQAGGTYTANAAATMYARWSSSTTTAAVTLPTPTRTGYTFKGWATSVTATSGTTGSYTPTGNVTLYAIWKVNSYTLSISATKGSVTVQRTSSPDGGATTGNLYNGNTIYYNDILKITFTANTGYTATTHTVNGSSFTSGNTKTVSSAISIVLTATANTYYVKFNANRGSSASGSGTMANQTFTYDVSQALTLNAFTRYFTVTYNANGGSVSPASANANSVFAGWATTSSGSVAYTDQQSVKNLTSTAGGTKNLYAKWSSGSVTLPSPAERAGYTFKGWYTAASGGTKIGNAGASYTPTAAITLYAQWTKITFTLSISASDVGVVVNVLRTSSPIGGASSGQLNNGATLYYGDELVVSYRRSSSYTLQQATVNGVTIPLKTGSTTEGELAVTVTQNQAVVVTVEVGAIVYIYNETTEDWDQYQAFIYGSNGWEQYAAYVYNDGNWEQY